MKRLACAAASILLACASCVSGAIYADDGSFYRAGSRLRPIVLEVGGIRVLHGWFDTLFGVECSFPDTRSRPDPEGAYYCEPALGTHSSAFGPFEDRACTLPVALVSDNPLPWVAVLPVDACAEKTRYHLVGPVAEGPFWAKTESGCEPYMPGPGEVFVRLGPEVTPPFVSAREHVTNRGARIEAIVRVADDGSREIVGAYDRDRDEPVDPQRTTDGVLRWLPRRQAFAGGLGHAECEGVASKLRHNASCPMKVVTSLPPSMGCGFVVSAIGRELLGDERRRRCGDGDAELYLFEVGPELPPATFVETTTTLVGEGRIRLRAHAADGAGAVVPDALFDTETNEPCIPALAVDGVLRCLPYDVAPARFADAACTAPAVPATSDPCMPAGPRGFRVATRSGAYAAYTAFGDPIPVYGRQDRRCVPSGLGYAVRERAPEELAPVVELRE